MKIKSKILSTFLLATVTSSCDPVSVAIIGGAGLLGIGATQERGVTEGFRDTTIETKLDALFLASKYKILFTNVDADAVEGRVLLTGHVPSEEVKSQAENLTMSISGVKEVFNHIQVSDSYDFKTKDAAKDTWVSTQVRSRLVLSKKVASINYSIKTVDGIVYLMGVARNKEELEIVTQVAAQVPGVKKVVSHIRLKADRFENSVTQGNSPSVDQQENNLIEENKPVIIEDISSDYPEGSSSDTDKWIKPTEVIEDGNSTLPSSLRMQDSKN